MYRHDSRIDSRERGGVCGLGVGWGDLLILIDNNLLDKINNLTMDYMQFIITKKQLSCFTLLTNEAPFRRPEETDL